jgi:hypothetical protein
MKQIAEKISSAVRTIIAEKGDVDLFALFLREDALDAWDVVFQADWASADKGDAIKYVAKKIASVLTAPERSKLSRIVVLEHSNASLENRVGSQSLDAKVRLTGEFICNQVPIRQAYLIVLKQPPVRKGRVE